MSTNTERRLYTVEEAAAALGIGITKAKSLIKSGELRSIKIGRCRRITVTSVDDFIQVRALREAAE